MNRAFLPEPSPLESLVNEALANADVCLGGSRPWDPAVYDTAVYGQALRGDLLGLGESFVSCRWDCDRVDELVARLARARLHFKVRPSLRSLAEAFRGLALDGGSRAGARRVASIHYDLSNELFRTMLGPTMAYSCGYWRRAANLDEAQENKFDLVCRKIGLERGMTVLDVGGGWGGFSRFAAEHYGARVVSVTVSREQYDFAQELCRGLPVEIRLQDYRDVGGAFDRIVSIGMFEHVGPKHYAPFFEKVRRLLSDDGLLLLHSIGSSLTGQSTNPWIERFVFPGGYIPSLRQVAQAIEGRFVMEDWHNFGTDYDRTLMGWFANFDAHWPSLKADFPPEFYRRWKLYLQGCAGAFRSRELQLWQIVLSPRGVVGGYRSVR